MARAEFSRWADAVRGPEGWSDLKNKSYRPTFVSVLATPWEWGVGCGGAGWRWLALAGAGLGRFDRLPMFYLSDSFTFTYQ